MTVKKKIDFSKVAMNVIKVPLEKFVEDSYLPYAHYVIMNRALTSDDGLKPVQRRILFAMQQLGLTDKKDFMKAAQVVGETMGKYHPHGDASIGDALSRMGQTFSMRVPLIDVQGSVGFTTGDPAAAPRYWEARPTAAAMELSSEVNQGAVPLGDNYDGKFKEPAMLPIKWPNGIINGSQGIAVGYSSNVIPHNPTEVMDAVIKLVKKPDLTIKELLKIMPGPDMPTGGVLMALEGVQEYYETGKGTFIIRGRYETTPGARGTHTVSFSEAPYQVSAEQIVTAVDDAKKKDRLKGVASVKDLSDIDHGFRLDIKLKAGVNPAVIMKEIFKYTPLEKKFPANMNILVNGVPTVSPMLELLQGFIDFRSDCIVNKTKFKIVELERQIERLDGIVAVLVDIDAAIKIIRKAEDAETANIQLQKKFKINDEQSTYILSMALRRLTKADSLSIKNEVAEKKKELIFLQTILDNEDVFNKYLIDELKETKLIIADERRTTVSNVSSDELKEEEKAVKESKRAVEKNSPCYVTLFADGTVTRTAKPHVQGRSPIGILTQLLTKTQEKVIFINTIGQAFKIPASYIQDDVMMDAKQTIGHSDHEIVGIAKETFDKKDFGLLLATSDGGVNIVNGGFPVGDEFSIINVPAGEVVLGTYWLTKEEFDNKSVVLVSSDANVLHFRVNEVRTSNSGAGTVRGLILNDDQTTVGFSVASEDNAEVISCTYDTIKVTDIKDIPGRKRGAKGVRLQRLKKEDKVLSAFASERVVGNKNDKSLRFPEVTERALSGDDRKGVDVILGHYEV